MGVAQVHHQLAPLHGDAVAHAVHVQGLFEAVGDAHHHVVEQGAGKPVQGTVLLQVVGTGDAQLCPLLLDGHGGVQLLGKGALGPLHCDEVIVLDLNLHAGGDGDRSSANSRHSYNPPYQTNARTSPPTWA